jgi:hypothetical protein
MGEYFSGTGAYFQQQPPPPGQAPMSGLGLISPVGRAIGQFQNAGIYGGAGGSALALAFLALGGYLSYQAGMAMTPGGSKPKTWGWIGVPVGLFTGPIGLGVMGIVSNRRKGR